MGEQENKDAIAEARAAAERGEMPAEDDISHRALMIRNFRSLMDEDNAAKEAKPTE